nr:protein kinase, ATP binding site-containing protein [Tanacetum cinerariifolium]
MRRSPFDPFSFRNIRGDHRDMHYLETNRIMKTRRILHEGNRGGIAPLFREWFSKGTIYDMVDPLLNEEIDENNFTLNSTFSKLAYECLSETHEKRPTTEAIIQELEKALYFQVYGEDE